MLNNNGERELRYVVSIVDIQPIPNYDRVEYRTVLGWHIIVRKDQFKVGDLAVYFEIDSKVPETEIFAFLEKRKYAVKTLKMCGVVSQGLLMSFDDLGWTPDQHKLGDFVTEELGITYYVPGDNLRKAATPNIDKIMSSRYANIFKQPWARWMMRREWGRKIMRFFFGNKKKNTAVWPDWVIKTDEERIQNIPYIINDKEPWIATEKIDGSSTTFTMRYKGIFHKKEFLVCSRNVVYPESSKAERNIYPPNIYLEMAEKYKIKAKMAELLHEHPEWNWITIQGETYGATVQNRDYHVTGRNFMAFNFVTSADGRWGTEQMHNLLEPIGIPCVPIVNTHYILPNSIDEVLAYAEGKSAIDGGVREGLVFRSFDGARSFKRVSAKYLLQYHR